VSLNSEGDNDDVLYLSTLSVYQIIQIVPKVKINILGGHCIGHSKQKNCIGTCVLFRTVSEIELFHCTV
jgi:hypothetical protein